MGKRGDVPLKVALTTYSEGSSAPHGSLITVKNAVVELGPKAVFCVGCFEGLNPEVTKLQLGDVVVSSKLTTESLKTPVGRDILRLVRHADHGWIPPLKCPEDHKVQVCCDGEILSGINPVSAQQQNVSRITQATAFKIGSEGLFAGAHDLKIELVIVKGISHFADGNIPAENSWESHACIMAASLVSNMLKDPFVFEQWPHYEDVLQLDKLSIVSDPSVKAAHEGESVEGLKDDNSKDPGEMPMTSASGVRDIRAATMVFEAKHEECIRVLPYIKDGQIAVHFYVYSGESGVPKDLEEEAQQFFKEMNVKLEWSDLYNNSANVLKVKRLLCSSGKPKTLTAPQVDKMNNVIEENLLELSKHRNITSVQASFKIKKSMQTDEPCITLYVLGKDFFPIGEPKFPNALGDYPVDVVNGFWTTAGSSKYWEPNSAQKPSKILCSGVSIGVQGKEAAGTLGAIVKNGRTFYALSNHHVMNSQQSNVIVHPALNDHLNNLRYYLAQYRREVKDVTDLETQVSVNDLTTQEALVSSFEELKSRKDIYVQGYSSKGELVMELIEEAEESFQQVKEPPREIGKWEVGVCENFLWSDGKKYYIDAAIAKLSDEEVKNFQGKTARLIGNDGKPSGCSPVDKETICNNRLCKSGRTTVYTEIENRIVGNDKNVESPPHFMIGSPHYDLHDLPFLSKEVIEFACETCEKKQFMVTESTEHLSCDECEGNLATSRMSFWRYRVLCISQGQERFAEHGDSGAVIFEIDPRKGDEKFLSGLGLFFAKGETEHDRVYFASPLKVALDALTDKLPKGSNLELVSKF